MAVLGHSRIAVTMNNTYGHVILARQRSAADEVDATLTGEDDGQP